MNILLSLIIFLPIIGVLLLSIINKNNEKLIKLVGFFATLPSLILLLLLVGKTYMEGAVSSFQEKINWIQIGNFSNGSEIFYEINYELGIDGLSLAMMTLTAILSTVASLISWHISKEWRGYYQLFLLLVTGMLGLFAAENFILFFLFFEITLITTFFLIGKWGNFAKEKAAYQFLIYNGLGSLILLIVIVTLFARTGTSNFDSLQFLLNVNEENVLINEITTFGKWALLIALIVALGIKLPIVPFHSWMVHVHKEAHPAVVMIHSGILLKIGAYGLIRVGMGIFPNEWKSASLAIGILGVINILYGAFLALQQKNLRTVWAYSSVSHMGFVLVGLAVLNEAGVQGAIFQTVSHGFISAFLFMLVSIFYNTYKTTELQELGGTAAKTPILSGLLLIGGLSALGLPGTSGFISEFTVILGALNEYIVLGILAAIALVFTAAYTLRAVLMITYGEQSAIVSGIDQTVNGSKRSQLRGFEWLSSIVFLLFIIALGVYPDLLTDVISDTVAKTIIGLGG